MKIVLVVAHGKNLEIGLANKLLWHIPEDLKQFKKVTMGKTMVMGRKTFESIGKVLPGRTTVVITRNPSWQKDGVKTFASLKAAINFYEQQGLSELLIVGGGEIYKEALPLAHEICATWVDFRGPADTYFPEYKDQFKEVESTVICDQAIFKVFKRK